MFEIIVKRQKKKILKKKQIENNFMKMWRMKKNDLHIKKIAVKKTEKIRVKQMKKMIKDYAFILLKLLIFIHDSKIA